MTKTDEFDCSKVKKCQPLACAIQECLNREKYIQKNCTIIINNGMIVVDPHRIVKTSRLNNFTQHSINYFFPNRVLLSLYFLEISLSCSIST